MCHLFLRLSRSLGEREGEHVRACITAAGQTRVKPQARGPRAGSCEARPSAPFSSVSHPRGFLAGVGEVGIESLSPDSFSDLVGCYPVISQISLHGRGASVSNTPVSSQKTEETEEKRKADHLFISSPSKESNNK